MICRYCKKFQDSELRENMRNAKGKIINQTRYCPTKDDMIEEKHPKCESFFPVIAFWCEYNEQWLDVKSCYNRQKKGTMGCPRCRQKELINQIEEKPILLRKRRII